VTKPVIGIPLGMKESSFSRLPHYAMEKNYFDAVSTLGGTPIALTYNIENYDDYLNMIDGILLPGGSFSSPTEWYEEQSAELPKAQSWSNFYKKLTQSALEKNIPILGICAGMQFLACVPGATMTKNVHQKLNTNIDHLNGAPKEEFSHSVTVNKKSKLFEITQIESFEVNSAHTEAVTAVKGQTVVSATCSEDECIEAIEIPSHKFAIGVQWHPEFFINDKNSPHYKIMKAFIDATK